MKIVPVVEMQTRLSELLSRSLDELIQVTYQGTAVVAVLPQGLYQAFREHVITQQENASVTFEITRVSLTETQHLFHSYRNRLAPHLQRNDGNVNIIEVMRRKNLIGAILAWDDWLSLAEQSEEKSDAPGWRDASLTIVAARNRLLQLVDQFANEEQRGIFRPITVTRQGIPVMAIVSWGWFQRITHVLRKQAAPFLSMETDGLLITSSHQAEPSEKSEREVIPDHIRELSFPWSRFQQTVSMMAARMPSLIDPNLLMTASFDHDCAELEDQCASVQRLAQELLVLIRVLPIHMAIMKQYPSLPDGIDLQALWEVEALARTTYEQAMGTGASKRGVWDATRQACLAWALQHSWSHGQFRLSHEIEQLVECVLIQVKKFIERRQRGMPEMEEEKRP
jgi:hypothetical protein